MPFNENLARERKTRGLSQEELAGRIQVSRQAVSKWETGDAIPDLNKLLVLADTLDISLDVLCGRKSQAASPLPQAAAPMHTRRLLWPFLCALLVSILAVTGIWAWKQRNIVPAEEAVVESPLSTRTDAFTVSGVEFHGKNNHRVGYQFTPSVSGEDYTYQITFTDSFGQAHTFDAPYNGGVCSGVADLDSIYGGYSVTVSVTDGITSRNLAVAMNLNFSEGGSSWTPLTD